MKDIIINLLNIYSLIVSVDRDQLVENMYQVDAVYGLMDAVCAEWKIKGDEVIEVWEQNGFDKEKTAEVIINKYNIQSNN